MATDSAPLVAAPCDHASGPGWDEFAWRARQLGMDPALLAQGAELENDVLLPSLEGGSYLTVATPQQLQLRRRHFFNPVINARRRLGQGIHDRCEAGAYAGFAVSRSDLEGLAIHLPFKVRAISVWDKSLGPGEVWDVSVNGAERYGLNERDDVICVLNLGTLRLAPGARIEVHGNLFFMLCQRIEIAADEAADDSHQIAILPTRWSVDRSYGPYDGVSGSSGSEGDSGAAGLAAITRPSLVGPVLVEDRPHGDLCGRSGGDGSAGQSGGRGRNGGAGKLAEVTIRDIAGHLSVRAEGGVGGCGGDGGHGGAGGSGGAGAAGVRTLQGAIAPGSGGDGGNGGAAGDGGRGGHGGISSNIYVCVPDDQRDRVSLIAVPAWGGPGGLPGRPGPGGLGGQGGEGSEKLDPGPAGALGQDGAAGIGGANGRMRPAAPMFLNEEPIADWSSEPVKQPNQLPHELNNPEGERKWNSQHA